MAEAGAQQVPSIGISYTVELPNKKGVVMQSFVERDCDPKELDKVLDKIRAAADRQAAWEMIQLLERELVAQQKQASDQAMRMAQVDENVKRNWARSGRKGDPQLSGKDQADQQQAYMNAKEIQKRIAMVKEDISKFRAMVG